MPKAGQHSASGAATAISWHTSQHHAIDRRSLRTIDDSVYSNWTLKHVAKSHPIHWIRHCGLLCCGGTRQRAGLDVDHRRERLLRLLLPAAKIRRLQRMGITELVHARRYPRAGFWTVVARRDAVARTAHRQCRRVAAAVPDGRVVSAAATLEQSASARSLHGARRHVSR